MNRSANLAKPGGGVGTKPVPTLVVALLAPVVVLALVALMMGCQQDGDRTEEPAEAVEEGSEAPPEGLEGLVPVTLYFPGEGGSLYAETHQIPPQENVEKRIAILVETLLAGPEGGGLRSPLPQGVKLRRGYLQEDGTAVVDFSSPQGAPPPASGSHQEMLRVWSVVNTVVLNISEVHSLLLLWNGEQPLTFAGHLDLARPLAANNTLVVAER